MMGFMAGLLIGVIFTSALHIHAMGSFKRMLVMKAEDGTSEYINGKFYYIKEEGIV